MNPTEINKRIADQASALILIYLLSRGVGGMMNDKAHGEIRELILDVLKKEQTK